MELIIILMEVDMKVNVIMISVKVMEYFISRMEVNMKVNLKMVLLKVMEYFIILMEHIKVNLKII